MEDHHYGMADLRPFMSNTSLFTSIPPPQTADILSAHHYEMVMAPPRPGLHHDFLADSSTSAGAASSGGAGFSGLELETAAAANGSGRWPRQETLTLLEIRSRLHPKFKEANQKGPLWDEVSRIMGEEHGYQRSGKKCREKFENLYKYYKKTKEGKAGRQDGKHYRFFRQLEALYGETSAISDQPAGNTFYCNNVVVGNHGGTSFPQASKLSDSLSLSNMNSSDFESTSSGESDDDDELNSGEKGKKRKGRRGWKCKIKEFIDQKMRKLMEKQEAWLEKMMNTIEQKEKERMIREEDWRKQEVGRMEREHKFWANERAWIEARDAALMEALHKLTAKEIPKSPDNHEDQNWQEGEITKLIQLRTNMESRFQQHIGCSDDVLWEEISSKMSCMGYNGNNNNAAMCRDKWISIKCNNKRRKENPANFFTHHNFQINNNGGSLSYSAQQPSPNHHHHHTNTSPNHGGFRFLMGDSAENLWENYVLKPSKGGDNI
ncbi:PREDICTED: trihelix transcription factor PTL-like [Ipomoea nil]|uniref:trihelix transcription factor PTL-like n=1 Tax=Ipomoea nil TaxID=35883 RepID=UPI000900D1F3|nr:PREDICTED: trihelix transcription factor PTL-like [Ipomoea nil]